MISTTLNKVKAQRPIIALTKSDECNISADTLSHLALKKGKVGLVSGTRSIVDSLLFTNSDILTKFMKENFLKEETCQDHFLLQAVKEA